MHNRELPAKVESISLMPSFRQSLPQLLTDIYRKYEERMPDGVLLNLHLPPDDIRIDTDAQRLRQVMENLIGNAVKFTTEGYIEIGCSRTGDGKGVSLFVADTGQGIAAQMRERIFDRFYKIDDFKQGAGLGLSVCKTIIEGMGGRIEVSSQPGMGSRFTVEIPIIR